MTLLDGRTLEGTLVASFPPDDLAVIQVHGDGDVTQADSRLDELLEVNRVGVLTGSFGNLEHNRGFFLFARFNDGLEQFHVVDVEGAESVFALQGFGEEVFGVCQWHICSASRYDRVETAGIVGKQPDERKQISMRKGRCG